MRVKTKHAVSRPIAHMKIKRNVPRLLASLDEFLSLCPQILSLRRGLSAQLGDLSLFGIAASLGVAYFSVGILELTFEGANVALRLGQSPDFFLGEFLVLRELLLEVRDLRLGVGLVVEHAFHLALRHGERGPPFLGLLRGRFSRFFELRDVFGIGLNFRL